MKRFIILTTCFFTVCFSSFSQNKSKSTKAKQKLENSIKQFWFVMLVRGDNRTQDSATAAKIQEGHMANINKLYSEGKLKVAGSFGDDGEWRGIFIFDPMATGCKTKEELQTLLNTDPAIAAGRLAYDNHPWYTSPIGSFKPGKPIKN